MIKNVSRPEKREKEKTSTTRTTRTIVVPILRWEI